MNHSESTYGYCFGGTRPGNDYDKQPYAVSSHGIHGVYGKTCRYDSDCYYRLRHKDVVKLKRKGRIRGKCVKTKIDDELGACVI
ncbi:MAG: hypothetical protein HQK89_07580 [Nitrospirae bacterium]|nr:hypothetical protein [Nitrospirota bacterium]